MKILAFHTTFKFCSAALMHNKKIFFFTGRGTPFQHSEVIIRLVKRLMSRSHLTLQDIDFLSVTHGPGMFTGVRVGLATAKGFSISLGVPIVSFSTFDSVVHGFLFKKDRKGNFFKRFSNILCILSPGSRYSYYQFFKVNKSKKGFVSISKPGFGDMNHINSILTNKGKSSPVCVIGNMNAMLQKSIYNKYDPRMFYFHSISTEPNAQDLIHLASIMGVHNKGRRISPMYIKPHYANLPK